MKKLVLEQRRRLSLRKALVKAGSGCREISQRMNIKIEEGAFVVASQHHSEHFYHYYTSSKEHLSSSPQKYAVDRNIRESLSASQISERSRCSQIPFCCEDDIHTV
jgi:hypothetical protein